MQGPSGGAGEAEIFARAGEGGGRGRGGPTAAAGRPQHGLTEEIPVYIVVLSTAAHFI